MKSQKKLRVSNRGYTVLELLVVISVIAVLSVVAIPVIRSLLIGGKTQPTASDIIKGVNAMRAATSGGGNTPYATLSGAQATAMFANGLRSTASSLVVSGTGATATVTHDIGKTGSNITVAPRTITTAGDSFDVTVPTVNESACPGLAAQLAKSSEKITIAGAGAAVTVLDKTIATPTAFDGPAATNACASGDVNQFVFTFR